MTAVYTVGKNEHPRFLAGGNSLSYSNNGIDWYQTTTDISLTNINALEYNGYVYVAGGSGIAYSDNATTWSNSTSPLSSINAIKWAGYGPRGGSLFVAGGASTGGNAMAYSASGINWTSVQSPFTQCYTLEWNGSFWLAGGTGNALAYSLTGASNWTAIDLSASIYKVMWNGSHWLIGGNTSAGAGYIAYSTNDNATAWTRVTSPIATRVTGLAYNGSRTVAVGNGSTLF
jgi:hypothetical protein